VSKQNEVKKSTIVLRTTLYIEGVEHIVETRKEIEPNLMNNMSIHKLINFLQGLVVDACHEHNNYWQHNWVKEK